MYSFITHQSTKLLQSPRISMTYCKFLILPALFSISFHTCNTSFGIFQFYPQTLKSFSQPISFFPLSLTQRNFREKPRNDYMKETFLVVSEHFFLYFAFLFCCKICDKFSKFLENRVFQKNT